MEVDLNIDIRLNHVQPSDHDHYNGSSHVAYFVKTNCNHSYYDYCSDYGAELGEDTNSYDLYHTHDYYSGNMELTGYNLN